MHWYDGILSDIVRGVKPITVVADSDQLLTEEKLAAELKRKGFIIERFDNSVDFRYVFETKYRNILGKNNYELLVTADNTYSVPFDVLAKARILEFSLNTIFPKLNSNVVLQLDNQYYSQLYNACQEHLSQELGENSTKEFILRHVFEIAPELIKRPEDLAVALLKKHYRGTNIPEVLDKKFISLLKRKPIFEDWPLEEIVLDRNAFWSFLQEQWKIYLKALNDETIRYLVPFDYDDIRVYVDNLFAEGFLEQVKIEQIDSIKSTWIKAGISGDTQSQEQRFNSLLKITETALPDHEATHHEWIAFGLKYSKLISAHNNNHLDIGKIDTLRQKANEVFENWLLNKYAGLSNLPAQKPAMVHHITRWMAAQKCTKQAIIVIDGLSLSQWLTIHSEIKTELTKYRIAQSALFAWIPTLTSISRQAIFSGKPPLFFPDSMMSTHREEKQWQAFWKNHGSIEREIAYINGVEKKYKSNEFHLTPKVKYLGLVMHTVDKIMHGLQLGEIGMHNQVKLWAKQGSLVAIIHNLLRHNFKVIITSDHGNLESNGIGKPDEGAVADIRGQRARIYNDSKLRDKTHKDLNQTIEWPAMGLPPGVYPLIAKNNKAFLKPGQNSVCHGGISIDETIVPFVTIEK